MWSPCFFVKVQDVNVQGWTTENYWLQHYNFLMEYDINYAPVVYSKQSKN